MFPLFSVVTKAVTRNLEKNYPGPLDRSLYLPSDLVITMQLLMRMNLRDEEDECPQREDRGLGWGTQGSFLYFSSPATVAQFLAPRIFPPELIKM